MNRKQKLAYWERVGRRVKLRHALTWFFGINVPVAIGLGLLFQWHEELVGESTPMHLLLRGLGALAAFGIGQVVIFRKVFRPAIRAEADEGDPPKGRGGDESK